MHSHLLTLIIQSVQVKHLPVCHKFVTRSASRKTADKHIKRIGAPILCTHGLYSSNLEAGLNHINVIHKITQSLALDITYSVVENKL